MAMNIRVSQKASNVVITTATKNFWRTNCLTWLVTIILLISCLTLFPKLSYLHLKTICKFRSRTLLFTKIFWDMHNVKFLLSNDAVVQNFLKWAVVLYSCVFYADTYKRKQKTCLYKPPNFNWSIN
jgi:hypothetical protein